MENRSLPKQNLDGIKTLTNDPLAVSDVMGGNKRPALVKKYMGKKKRRC